MKKQLGGGEPASHIVESGKRPPLVRIIGFSVLMLGIICLALWGIVLINSGSLMAGTPNLTATARTEKDLSCKQLVEQAMQESEAFCQNIGTNQLCYGNFSVKADLAQGINADFSERGDVIDVDILRRLSAAPLDLTTQAWGIAVFKVTANLPRSLPGQTVTVLVFGNTTLDKDGPGLHTFYFFSDTGQVICDEVPFDGLFITMPDGVGAQFNINGAELVLTGTASITATLGEGMNISLFSGSAQVTADGQTQIFGPGQQVSIPLGGENGMQAVGPPSEPTPLSDEELALACTMTGENCQKEPIPTLSLTDLAATVESELGDGAAAPTENLPASTSTPANTATALPSPTPFPTATLAPPRTSTPLPTWTSTKKPPEPPAPTNTPVPPTNTPVPPTNTPLPPTEEPTEEPPEICDNVSMGAISFSASQLSVNITNNSGGTITLNSLVVNWIDEPANQRIQDVTLNSASLWSGNNNTTPSLFEFTGPVEDRQIANGNSATLTLTFALTLENGNYDLTATFDSCTASQSGTLP
jgi:hypothetical protein